MRADWTNQNEEIAHFLADFGRYSIPFYLLYRPGAEPHLFPELLTKRDVLRVLDESAGARSPQRVADLDRGEALTREAPGPTLVRSLAHGPRRSAVLFAPSARRETRMRNGRSPSSVEVSSPDRGVALSWPAPCSPSPGC